MQVTEFDAEPIPNMEEIINKMSGRKYFTKVDLSKGYWQVSLKRRGLNLSQHLKHLEVYSNLELCPLVASILRFYR